jgi:hypothetical protein
MAYNRRCAEGTGYLLEAREEEARAGGREMFAAVGTVYTVMFRVQMLAVKDVQQEVGDGWLAVSDVVRGKVKLGNMLRWPHDVIVALVVGHRGKRWCPRRQIMAGSGGRDALHCTCHLVLLKH